MRFTLFVVMTLFSVQVYADLYRDNSTLAGFNENIVIQKESATADFVGTSTVTNGTKEGVVAGAPSTTNAVKITQISEQTTQPTFANEKNKQQAAVTSSGEHKTETVVDETTVKSTVSPKASETSYHPTTHNQNSHTEKTSYHPTTHNQNSHTEKTSYHPTTHNQNSHTEKTSYHPTTHNQDSHTEKSALTEDFTTSIKHETENSVNGTQPPASAFPKSTKITDSPKTEAHYPLLEKSSLKPVVTTAVFTGTEKRADVTTLKTTVIPETAKTPDSPETDIHSLPSDSVSNPASGPNFIIASTQPAHADTYFTSTGNDVSSKLHSTEKTMYDAVEVTTKTSSKSQTGESNVIHDLETTTIASSAGPLTKLLEHVKQEIKMKANETEFGEKNNERAYKGKKGMENRVRFLEDPRLANVFDPEKMPPREFMEWLNSIHPDNNDTEAATVAATNIIDTSIISTEKLIIVICTICGTFVLFVAILIAISCCRRNRNIRNDSEKSDFSVTSVVSMNDKRKSGGSFSSEKSGFNNLFMGIPPNNEVWKNLEQLSPVDSSVMPESTKM